MRIEIQLAWATANTGPVAPTADEVELLLDLPVTLPLPLFLELHGSVIPIKLPWRGGNQWTGLRIPVRTSYAIAAPAPVPEMRLVIGTAPYLQDISTR